MVKKFFLNLKFFCLANLSKQALKNRKKQAAKKSKAPENVSDNVSQPATTAPSAVRQQDKLETTGDPDKDKKIKNLMKVKNDVCYTF